MKNSKANIQHLMVIKQAFLNADEDTTGFLSIKDLLHELSINNYQFDSHFLQCVLDDLTVTKKTR